MAMSILISMIDVIKM